MVKVIREVTIRQLKEPLHKSHSECLSWVCASLGYTPRKNNRVPVQIIGALAEKARKGGGLTSEELSQLVDPTRSAVIYHLNKLIRSGLVMKFGPVYELRSHSLQSTVDEVEKDLVLGLDRVRSVAKLVDEQALR